MIYVHLANRYNSTIFTNCCQVAILPSEAYCPRCEKEVFPAWMPQKFSAIRPAGRGPTGGKKEA